MSQIKAGIIGATGYAGVELIRILLGHPDVTISAISSVSFEGKALSEVYPSMYQLCDMVLTDEDTVIERKMCIRDRPRVMGVRELLTEWLAFRTECVRRRVYFDLKKKQEKLHPVSYTHLDVYKRQV